ncbi:hypothetical protein IC582_027111 [Cucumis melo]|uniref:diaminohydroxyphosphoribosylaminopyrimidine deaminase n=2 Tax=Cucumis melo TaxID=3656 RepID=A0A1S3C822_CUCME|nr:riboflavin biosynthesis protein PYRD, chloroplastic [Cucumis melo]XP_050947921.1 riboflavin biosynthesis protein PYRD, chloroplastic [Cucumis melo]
MALNSLSFFWNATPKLTPPTTLNDAHSPSIYYCNHNDKLKLHDCSRSRVSSSVQWMVKSGSCRGGHSVRCVNVIQGVHCDVDDEVYMRRSLEIARKAIGHTSPNPMVGCVIVKNGEIVGEGFHPKAGQPHAEVFALREAGNLAENATAYVTLEPCNHYGRTPPCTEALIKAKVKRVVVGMVDPNPIVASKGVQRLRDAGIDVTVSIEEDSCKKLNEAYIHQILTGKPLLTLRYTLSLNGCFLDQVGKGAAEAGGYYSQLLQEYNAVIISPPSSSEEFEIPSSNEHGAKQPLWIILSSPDGSIPVPRITNPTTKVVILTNKEEVVSERGIETVVLDQLNMNNILNYCQSQGLNSVMWDVRAKLGVHEELIKEGIEEKLLQKVVVEVLPQWSESQSESWFKSMAENLKLKCLEPRMCGQSVVLEGNL